MNHENKVEIVKKRWLGDGMANIAFDKPTECLRLEATLRAVQTRSITGQRWRRSAGELPDLWHGQRSKKRGTTERFAVVVKKFDEYFHKKVRVRAEGQGRRRSVSSEPV